VLGSRAVHLGLLCRRGKESIATNKTDRHGRADRFLIARARECLVRLMSVSVRLVRGLNSMGLQERVPPSYPVRPSSLQPHSGKSTSQGTSPPETPFPAQ
jgi:hypothetical protein